MIHLAVAHVVAELNAYLNLRAPAPIMGRAACNGTGGSPSRSST